MGRPRARVRSTRLPYPPHRIRPRQTSSSRHIDALVCTRPGWQRHVGAAYRRSNTLLPPHRRESFPLGCVCPRAPPSRACVSTAGGRRHSRMARTGRVPGYGLLVLLGVLGEGDSTARVCFMRCVLMELSAPWRFSPICKTRRKTRPSMLVKSVFYSSYVVTQKEDVVKCV